MKGFTLLEILLVMILVGMIIGFSAYWYSKISQSSFILDETTSMIINYLNLAKQKAMLAEENSNWGILVVNNNQDPDYLHLLKENTNNIKETQVLPNQIDFVLPSPNSSQIILFKKLTGETTSTIIQIRFANSSLIRYIVVPTSGAIYVTSTSP